MKNSSSVLAVVPHFKGEQWLAASLASLVGQSRPCDGIVVVDDASCPPPAEIVAMFPQVTLMSASINVGQYCLVQEVIDQTDYDAYLFQDADDWAHHDRLKTLLTAAEATGADLVGSYEVRVSDDRSETIVEYPTDVNEALKKKPGAFPLLLCTSLASRALLWKVGGLATGMRVCGDYDFVLRAHYAGKLLNVDEGLYFRRIHSASLTARPETGFISPQRQKIHRILIERDEVNAKGLQSGRPPDLRPYSTAGPVCLTVVCGPPLAGFGKSQPKRRA